MDVRYFVFLYPEDNVIRELLDLAIFLINPAEKWRAHVTLAGPLASKRSLPRKTEFRRKVSLVGAGQFRSETQSTVFLAVGATDLQDFWNKPDYPFNPHLTIYDGDNSALADALFTVLKHERMFFKFYVSKVDVVRSVRGQGSMDLISHLVPNALPALKGKTVAQMCDLTSSERVSFAIECLKRAKYQSQIMQQPF